MAILMNRQKIINKFIEQYYQQNKKNLHAESIAFIHQKMSYNLIVLSSFIEHYILCYYKDA